jgi:hypothetical protein
VEKIAENWCKQIRLTRGQSVDCQHYLEIRYEDLILKTNDVLERICVFIDLPFEPAMERYYLSASQRMDELGDTLNPDGTVAARKDARLARHRWTSRPPEPSRIGRWKTELTKEDLACFNQIGGELLAELGYET